MQWTPRLSTRSSRFAASEIRELLKLLNAPEVVSFAGGVPDPALFPREELRAAYDRLLANPKSASLGLQYTTTEGYLPLREWICGYLRRDDVKCDPKNIIILNGSQQGLDFAAKLFIDPGDSVLVQNPTYLGALQAFRSYECEFEIVCSPSRYIEPQEHRERKGVPKLLYAAADFLNPTGLTLSQSERSDIVAMAEKLDVPILEDNAYRHLRFEGTPLPLLTANQLAGRHIDEGQAMYLGTFSKSVAPGLRIAWLAAPARLLQLFVLVKQASDVQVSTLNQMALTEVVCASFESLVENSRAAYRRRRDCMLDAIARHFPPEVTWTRPEGGFFVWVTLPRGLDAASLLEQSLKEIKVAFVPGKPFFADGSGRNSLRLSYSLATPDQIERGIALLGQLLKRAISEHSDMRKAGCTESVDSRVTVPKR